MNQEPNNIRSADKDIGHVIGQRDASHAILHIRRAYIKKIQFIYVSRNPFRKFAHKVLFKKSK